MKNINKFLITGLIVFIGFCSLTSSVNAKDSKLDFTVTRVAGNFEKLKEKITLFLKFNKKAKVDYYQYLAEKRLSEISYVIEKNDIDMVEPTASRYSTYISILASFVDKNRATDKKDDLIKMYERHDQILTDLQSKFKFESGWWLAIQNDINNTRLFADKIKSL